MRLGALGATVLFGIGAAGGLVGDACHVSAGTTTYLDNSLPFIWKSALWFPVAVGLATVAAGELRLRLGPPRAALDNSAPGEASAAISAVIGIYALTAVLTGEDPLAATVLVWALAVLVAVRFGGARPALACAALAATLGPLAEIAVVEAELARYSAETDGLLGVAEWLPALYFAFGIVAALLAELLTEAEAHSAERKIRRP